MLLASASRSARWTSSLSCNGGGWLAPDALSAAAGGRGGGGGIAADAAAAAASASACATLSVTAASGGGAELDPGCSPPVAVEESVEVVMVWNRAEPAAPVMHDSGSASGSTPCTLSGLSEGTAICCARSCRACAASEEDGMLSDGDVELPA